MIGGDVILAAIILSTWCLFLLHIVKSFSNTIVKVMFQHYHKTEFSSKSDYLSIFYVPEIQTYVYIQYVNLKRQGEFRHMLLK